MSKMSEVTDWLAANPKLMGALWMATLLLAEAGPVVASGDVKMGP
ncbi:DUF7503 family protein [Halorussus aquaticus]